MSLESRVTLKGIPDWFANFGYRAGSMLVTRIPESVARATGRGIGLLCWALQSGKRQVLLENLRKNSLPKNRRNASRHARGAFGNFGESVVETLQLPHLSQEDILERVSIENEEAISELPRDTGAILLTVHTANWEWAGAALSAKGYSVRALARNHSPRVDRFYGLIRSRFGVKTSATLDRGQDTGSAQLLVLFCDRNGSKSGIHDFSRAAERAASLALRRGWHLIPGWTSRTRAGRYRIELGPAVQPDKQSRLRCARKAEMFLRQKIQNNPEQWFAIEPLVGPNE